MTRNILIVDDDRLTAQVMADALEPLGADIQVVQDGVEAVAKIREWPPDVVITDIEMPRMNGHKLIQWIRSNPDVDSLVIAVTAHSTPHAELEILEGGADEFVAKPIPEPILRARVRALLRLKQQMHELQESNTRYREAVAKMLEQREKMDAQQRRLEEITITDELTSIFNRRFLNRRSETEFSISARYGTALSCLLADLDRFKSINDEFGHAAGDAVLKEFAAMIKTRLRQGDLFGRWGGEEFMVLLPHTAAREARQLAEELREMTRQHEFRFGGVSIPVRVSIGVVSVPRPSVDTVESYFSLADQALYQAKHDGRDCVRWAPEEPEN